MPHLVNDKHHLLRHCLMYFKKASSLSLNGRSGAENKQHQVRPGDILLCQALLPFQNDVSSGCQRYSSPAVVQLAGGGRTSRLLAAPSSGCFLPGSAYLSGDSSNHVTVVTIISKLRSRQGSCAVHYHSLILFRTAATSVNHQSQETQHNMPQPSQRKLVKEQAAGAIES